jgi:M3 family oligoendopeptidase
MKFSEMPYERPDVQNVLAKMDELTARTKAASSAEEQLAILKEMEALITEVDTMASLCYVRNTINTKDPFYEAERKFNDDNTPLLTEKMQAYSKVLYDSPYRDGLEKELGKLFFQNLEFDLKTFSPEIIPLMQEESELKAAYQKLYASAQVEFDGKTLTIPQLSPYKMSPDRAVRKAAVEAEGGFFDAHREEFDELFDKLVKNRTAQAKKLGMKDFVELGYLRRHRNCYNADGVANFRRQVVEDLVPITVDIKKAQAKRIGVTDFMWYDQTFCFPDGNATPQGTPDELLAAAKQMYTEMSPETAEFIKMMFDMELFDVLSKDGKAPGGYCTSFPKYHCPFIFSNFNGTSDDVDVLTHEAGHAFADHICEQEIPWMDLRQPTMEGCETHSMSMEFLTSPWHHLFFKEQTAKYELSHAEDALIFIPYGCMVDHFQEIIYSNPDMTPQQRNEAWAELEKQYRPYLSFDGIPFYGRGAGWQRQLHIYQYPFYYIDYCLAQTAAFQIWVKFLDDPKAAWETYMSFVKLGGTKTFVDLCHAVGLQSPLDDGCIKSIAGTISNWLRTHQI